MTLLTPSPGIPTAEDLLDRLGGIPAKCVRYYPAPGTATEQGVIDIEAREKRLYELVDPQTRRILRGRCSAALGH